MSEDVFLSSDARQRTGVLLLEDVFAREGGEGARPGERGVPGRTVVAELEDDAVGAHAPDVDNVAVDSVFQTASILTTTGYTVGNYEHWPQICQAVLLFLMFVGACSSSAGGGLKVIRLVMLAKLIGHGVSMRLHPQYYEAIKVNKNNVSPDVMSGVCNYTLLYASMVVLGSIAVSFETNDMMTAFTSVVSCIGNIGPCFEVIGSSGCYASFGGFSKLILSVLMIAGRLELYTFFILFSPHYWTQKY